MPESSTTQTPVTPPPPASTPPPSGGNTSPVARFPDDPSLPTYARGRTYAEVLGLTDTLLQRAFTQPEAPKPQTPPVTLDPEGYVTGGQVQSWAREQIASAVNPELESAHNLAASAVYSVVQNRHAKEFGKYRGEIDSYLARMPKKQWTLDNMETVVKLVKADHFADYQAEWETDFRAKVEPTIRSGGAGGSVPVPENKENSLESEKIPAEWKLRAQQQGITESTVREFCASQGMSETAFYKQFETPMNPIVAEVRVGK